MMVSSSIWTPTRLAALQDSLDELANAEETIALDYDLARHVIGWAERNRLEQTVVAELAVGFWSNSWPLIESQLQEQGLRVSVFRRSWDDSFYPFATEGFFKLKKVIPKLRAHYAKA
ncbi:MAG: hypothetical protein AAFX93_17035 [Verrucomicrobiota bacterium]